MDPSFLSFASDPTPAPMICLLGPGEDARPLFEGVTPTPGHPGTYLPIPPSDLRYQYALAQLRASRQGDLFGFRVLDYGTGRVEIEMLAWGRFYRVERVLHVAVFVSTRTRARA